ncbi:universal stress protein [Cupriavidus neocaledonicus]|uniref:Universal stress protein n=1 Tax=Cupriavidus neocaledonicus TaxID=1040979 RepID=A0A375HLI3_9BURK|nr:universal stress protein [Cupriavidus neocaledonicus]SOZ39572.1 Universal stress protein [Cupriavidus neocaledonicus]SPD58712.1 Universal stress protein [Cupriavidus neocaledonicus]
MIKLLVVADDSDSSLWAVRHAAFLCTEGCAAEVVLLNVQRPIEHGRASAYHSLAELRERERQAGEAVLARAADILADSGVKHVAQIGVGTPVQTIISAARACACDGILLGVSCWSRILALAGAGVPARIMRRSPIPVTLVNAPRTMRIPGATRPQWPTSARNHPALVVYPASVSY